MNKAFIVLAAFLSMNIAIFAEETALKEDQSPLRVSLSSGIRRDTLKWSISGKHKKPNILSEVTYKNITIIPYTLSATYQIDEYFTRFEGTYGTIHGGKERDSDYYKNNRKGEFSRSTAKIKGSYMGELTFLVGKTFALTNTIDLIPTVGYTWLQEKIRVRGGKQKLAAAHGHIWKGSAKMKGLNSTYKSTWDSPFIGLGSQCQYNEKLAFRADYRFLFLTQFRGEGYWNLRKLSFTDRSKRAKGFGHQISVGTSYKILDNVTVFADITAATMHAKDGTEKNRPHKGSSHKGPFHRASLVSKSARLGVTYSF